MFCMSYVESGFYGVRKRKRERERIVIHNACIMVIICRSQSLTTILHLKEPAIYHDFLPVKLLLAQSPIALWWCQTTWLKIFLSLFLQGSYQGGRLFQNFQILSWSYGQNSLEGVSRIKYVLNLYNIGWKITFLNVQWTAYWAGNPET